MGSIKNYGHFWAVKSAHWNLGGAGETGHLKGYCGRGKNKQIVDFRRQIGVYVLFTENREVIYVGQAGAHETRTIFGRLKRHTRDHLRGRWSHFSWFGLRDIGDGGELLPFANEGSERPVEVLNEIEAILIHLFEPRLNLRRGTWGQGTKEYYQYLDSDSTADDDDDG